MKSLELFAGAGGLALGVSQAGFGHVGIVEWNADACESMRKNVALNHPLMVRWPIHQADVRKLNYRDFGEDLDLVAGGVPWSQGGKHAGQIDNRNLFPEMIRAVREIRPKAVLIENVKGLLRDSFATYFEYITLSLAHPEVVSKPSEDWKRHLRRLEAYHSAGSKSGLEYNVTFRLLNAADYGVPQKRERVFIVAFRSDLACDWSFPEPTHSSQSLAIAKWSTGRYWKQHGLPMGSPRLGLRAVQRQLDKIDLFAANLRPWVTVRDALRDLPPPRSSEGGKWRNHLFMPGARSYAGHTGSPLDEPAKTLKAGDHGVPGGENMLVQDDNSVRYFTIRESARLQTFPDDYVFATSWTESMRQIGNAVPMRLAEIMAQRIGKHILIHNAKGQQNYGFGIGKAV
jgi:DNA (cytosine-5)-methyltransferase 1